MADTTDPAPSAIVAALSAGQPEVARRLAASAPPDLWDAAALGDLTSLAARLADPGARAALHEARAPEGWTPLHLAAFFGGADAVRLLLAHGAPIDMRSANALANTPLCAGLAGLHAADVAPVLLDAGADASAVVGNGVTPLLLAASRGLTDIAMRLIAAGADPAHAMADGTTPAMIARARGHDATAAALDKRR